MRSLRECAAEEDDLPIHRKELSGSVGAETSVADHFLSGLGPGQPLGSATRTFFEPRFGRDFSGVRIHTDAQAAEFARAINARAFTARDHVVFDKDSYRPQTRGGKLLLAHELTHVMQQTIPSAQTAIHRQPQQQELPPYGDPKTFTVVKTKPAGFRRSTDSQSRISGFRESGNRFFVEGVYRPGPARQSPLRWSKQHGSRATSEYPAIFLGLEMPGQATSVGLAPVTLVPLPGAGSLYAKSNHKRETFASGWSLAYRAKPPHVQVSSN